MKIKRITEQNRRDFRADMECEHCGHESKLTSGYDDTFYHTQVIPNMKCEKCGKKASSEYRPLTTKYPDSQVV